MSPDYAVGLFFIFIALGIFVDTALLARREAREQDLLALVTATKEDKAPTPHALDPWFCDPCGHHHVNTCPERGY